LFQGLAAGVQAVTATVFIVDDDDSVRRSLSRLLRAEGFGTEDFESASAYLERDEYDGVGCILLDINMPEMSGMELQARLADLGHALPVVFLTGHGDVTNSVVAMKRGALDFLTKPVDEADLLRAVRQALEHHGHVREVANQRSSILDQINSLTPREQQVMGHLITGAFNKVIADRLQIAVKTVKVHRAHIMEKMGVRSAAELLHLCHLGGIEPDSDITSPAD
jgi:two-component system response regulator FixJ